MKKILMIIFALCCFLCSCSKDRDYSGISFFTMDTYANVIADTASDKILNEVKNEVIRLDRLFDSDYINEYLTYEIVQGGEESEDILRLVEISDDAAKNTDGAFDYTLGALTALWDIKASEPTVPSDEKINETLSHVGYEKVIPGKATGEYFDYSAVPEITDDKLKLNFGAVAKGYAGDRAIEVLKNNGIGNAAISLGGNVTAIGSSKDNAEKGIYGWSVAINNPFDTGDILGRFIVCDSTVSVSGSYERYFESGGKRYHHIIDRKTGRPSDSGLVSVAVISESGAYADALSTALFVMGYEKALNFYESGIYDFEAVFCTEMGEVFVTDGLKEEFAPNFSAMADGKNIVYPQYD